MPGTFIMIAVILAALVALMVASYVKAPPDTAYIISGFRKPRILIGKAGFRIPFLERLDKLSLKMFSVDVKTADFVPMPSISTSRWMPPSRSASARATK